MKAFKLLIVLATLSFSSAAFADTMLNGIGYDADEMCFDGTHLVAQVTKTRNLIRENGQGDKMIVGSVTVNAGDSFMWRQATSYRENGQGDSVAVLFDRNGSPVVIDTKTRGGDDNETVTITKTPVPSC